MIQMLLHTFANIAIPLCSETIRLLGVCFVEKSRIKIRKMSLIKLSDLFFLFYSLSSFIYLFNIYIYFSICSTTLLSKNIFRLKTVILTDVVGIRVASVCFSC